MPSRRNEDEQPLVGPGQQKQGLREGAALETAEVF